MIVLQSEEFKWFSPTAVAYHSGILSYTAHHLLIAFFVPHLSLYNLGYRKKKSFHLFLVPEYTNAYTPLSLTLAFCQFLLMCPYTHPSGVQRPWGPCEASCVCGRWSTSVETDPFDENAGDSNVLLAEIEDSSCPPYLPLLTCAFCFLPTFSQAFSFFLAECVADNKVW